MALDIVYREASSSRRRLRGIALPFGLLVLWELFSHSGLVNPQFLPPLEKVAATAVRETINGELPFDLLVSLRRDLTGFAIGTVLGGTIGILLGLSSIADRIFTTWFNGLKQIALLAWIPLISIWFGFDEAAKIVFIALAASIPVILNIVEGIRGTSRKDIEVGEIFQFSRWQFIWSRSPCRHDRSGSCATRSRWSRSHTATLLATPLLVLWRSRLVAAADPPQALPAICSRSAAAGPTTL